MTTNKIDTTKREDIPARSSPRHDTAVREYLQMGGVRPSPVDDVNGYKTDLEAKADHLS